MHLTLLQVSLAALLVLPQAQTPPPDPAQAYEAGVRAIEEANWVLAIERFEQVLAADANHVPSRFYLAVAYDETGRPEQAIDEYRRVLDLDDVFEARMNLGALLAEGGRLDEAVIQFGEAMEQAPNDPLPARSYAELLDQLQRNEDAIGAYQRVIEIAGPGPVAAEAYRNLGSLYLRTGAEENAYTALSRSVAFGIDEAGVHAALGDLALRDEEIPRTTALAHYDRALALDALDPEIAMRRAIVLADLDRAEEALEVLENIPASEVSLSETELDTVIGTLYLDLERFEDAVVVWSRVVDEEPEVAGHWTRLGTSYRGSGRPEEAIAPLRRALVLDPENTEALGTLASIHHQAGDFPAAIELFERYVELRPQDATARHSLAVAYDELENFAEALVHYIRFLEIDDGTNDARRFQTERRVESLEQLLENR